MTYKIVYTTLFLLVLTFASSAFAQETPAKNWDVEKIKGVRQLPYPSYMGFPYFTDTWVLGKIEMENGIVIDSLNLRYSSYKDELIYYNKDAVAQIVIDKHSLKGFSFTGKNGDNHIFRKLYYDDYQKSDRYFEVLSDGETSLLAFRKVSLDTSTPYKENSEVLKNMVYNLNYSFYFYSPEKGYLSVRMNQLALLSKFDKLSQKQIKKLLRKNKIRITGEESFVTAWKIVEKEGYKVVF